MLCDCTAQSKTAKVIADTEQERAVQSPSGAPIAVEMSQVEDFFKSTIDSLTSKLTNKIDEKLQSFKRQIVEEQSSRLDSAVNRFKKEGNRQMYEHEEKVMGVLVEVKEAVAKSDAVVAVQRIEEGMNLVKNRMKLIKVADRSQYGWSTVKEYEQDDLASDSEDEKRLTRSERQAERSLIEASMGGPLLKNTSRMTLHQIQKTKRDSRDLRDKLKGRSKPCWLNVPNRRTRDFSRSQSVERKFKVHHLLTTLGLVDF